MRRCEGRSVHETAANEAATATATARTCGRDSTSRQLRRERHVCPNVV